MVKVLAHQVLPLDALYELLEEPLCDVDGDVERLLYGLDQEVAHGVQHAQVAVVAGVPRKQNVNNELSNPQIPGAVKKTRLYCGQALH